MPITLLKDVLIVEDKGYLREASQSCKTDNDTVSTLLKVVRDMQEEMKSIKGAVANSKSTKPQRAITCNFCKKKSHIKKDCYSYQSWLKRSSWKAKQKANILA